MNDGGGGGGGYLKSKPGFPLWGWRVGIPREYNVAELSDEVRAAWSAAAEACEALGATVVPVSLPHTAAGGFTGNFRVHSSPRNRI